MLSSPSFISLPDAQDVVVIGDGPMALITALVLIKNGVNNITLVGPHLGEFTRSGDFVDITFELVSDLLGIPIEPSHGFHIKDLENQLYDYILTKPNIKLVKKKFEKFADDRQLILKDSKEVISTLHADVIFECTGERRAVVHQFNQEVAAKTIEEKSFTVTPLIGNPQECYAIVRVLMTEENINAFNNHFNVFDRIPDPLVYALKMEELRNLKWHEFAPPVCYANNEMSKKTLIKCNTYTEIPEDLTDPEKIFQFVNLLLQFFKSNLTTPKEMKLHKPSKKNKSKSMISKFELKPHYVFPVFKERNKKIGTLFIIGDAGLTVPFPLGKGVSFGILKMLIIFNSLEISNGKITGFNLQKFTTTDKLSTDINISDLPSYEAELQGQIDHIELHNFRPLKQHKKLWDRVGPELYIRAEKNCPLKYQATIRSRLIQFQRDSFDYLTQAKNFYEETKKDNFERNLEPCLKNLKKAIKLQLFLTLENRKALLDFSLELIKQCEKLADFYYKNSEWEKAANYYHQLLYIYAELPGDFTKELPALYKNLIVVSDKGKHKIDVEYFTDEEKLLQDEKSFGKLTSQAITLAEMIKKIAENYQNYKTNYKGGFFLTIKHNHFAEANILITLADLVLSRKGYSGNYSDFINYTAALIKKVIQIEKTLSASNQSGKLLEALHGKGELIEDKNKRTIVSPLSQIELMTQNIDDSSSISLQTLKKFLQQDVENSLKAKK